jgi:hypothetical protein
MTTPDKTTPEEEKTRPLLPNHSSLPEDKWSGFGVEGIQLIQPNSFERRLYSIDELHESGIPEILAHPFAYSIKLRNYVFIPHMNIDMSDLFLQFSTLIKAIFLGIIEPVRYPLENLGPLGKMVESAYPAMENLVTLEWDGTAIGGIYPESLVFPGIGAIKSLNDIQSEIIRVENHYGLDKIKHSFARWVKSITNMETPPTWADRLNNMISKGGTWDASDDKFNADDIAGGELLGLLNVDVSDNGNNPTITKKVRLVRYTDHILICNSSGEVVSLSNARIELNLNQEGHINCNDPVNNITACATCNNIGKGPEILQKGFFKDKNGEFIIWKDFENCPLPDGCTAISYSYLDRAENNNGHAILTFGNLSLKISGKLLTPDDIRCDKTIGFAINDRTDVPIKPATDVPIKPEYIHLVDWDEANLSNNRINLLKLKGGATFNCNVDNLDTEDGSGSSILLFPSFECPKWKVNYAYLIVEKPELLQKDISMRLFNIEPNSTEELTDQSLKNLEGQVTELPITHIALTLGGDTELGLIKIKRRRIDPGTANLDISLDFGTSNTILAYSYSTPGQKPKELKITDKTMDVLDNSILDKSLVRDNYYWLPTFEPRDEDVPVTSIPSEIKCKDKPLQSKSLNTPIKNYSVSSPWYEVLGEAGTTLSNFKWYKHHALFTGAELRKAYLKLIMHIAMATLREDKACRSISFKATYPLAFNMNTYDEYRNLFYDPEGRGLLAQLSKETGIEIVPSMVDNSFELISESHAGRSMFLTSGRELVIDIGGGTIDIALSQKDQIIAVDSIKYGGNKFIEYLVKTGLPIKVEANQSQRVIDLSLENNNYEEKFFAINSQIRKLGFLKAIVEPLQESQEDEDVRVLAALKLYFCSILGYIIPILNKHEIQNNITIYPIGNAWQFLFADTTISSPEEFVKSYFASMNITADVNNANLRSGKKAVAKGALHIKTIQRPDLTKPIKNIVGLPNAKIGKENIDMFADIPLIIEHQGKIDDLNVELKNCFKPDGPDGRDDGYLENILSLLNLDSDYCDNILNLDTVKKQIRKSRTDFSRMMSSLNKIVRDNSIQLGNDRRLYLTRSLHGIFLEEIFQSMVMGLPEEEPDA